ncbi:MAG: S-layer homology domain-containing protein [Oscillospiraceae bacterium]|nr:S-layer homology domain-containing protein [Oscillospiraceae bacterium]
MKHRIIAVLLVLCLCASLASTVAAAEPTLETSVDLDQLVEHATSMYKHLEAGDKYDSVVNTNAGCVGMGIMGWIGSSALQLLKWCASSEKGGDPEYCRSVLGDSLYNEVVNAPVAIASTLMPNWNYWRYRTFSGAELEAARTLLGSEVGIRAQRALARCCILTQAQHGWNAGVRTESALIYYCSAENHYGEGSVKNFMKAVRTALGLSENDLILSLDQFHQGTMDAAAAGTVSTLNYRTKVYKYLTKTLGLPSGPDQGGSVNNSGTPFTDLPDPDHWAYDAIIWAYTSTPQVTGGTSPTTFSPDATLTRAEAMTFLWAASGRPEPISKENPFQDTKETNWFYTSVLWAVENGYTGGTTPTTFSPTGSVSTAEMLTFLWAFAGRPVSGGSENPFSDVKEDNYFYAPVVWAYNDGILVGNEGTGTELGPMNPSTRAYVVTYLYRCFLNQFG